MAQQRYLSPRQRAAVIRETFEAITAVGFAEWKAEERALGNELTKDDWRLYCHEFEKNHFAEFEKLAAGAPDDRLLDARADWIERANVAGLRDWREEREAARPAMPERSQEPQHRGGRDR